MKFKKIISFAISTIMAISILSGCSLGGKEETDEDKEIKQNDYRGGVVRTYALKKSVSNLMNDMKQNNGKLRENNPNSFWVSNGYQDFVTNFLNTPIIDDTQWFNEEESSWQEIIDEMSGEKNSFTDKEDGEDDKYSLKSGIDIIRNEKDDYSITGVTNEGAKYQGDIKYRILYDCDKDWCKATKTITMENKDIEMPSVTDEMYEYARLDSDKFAIQTSKERLMVVFESTDKDTDIRDRKIKEFYYSKLTLEGARTTFKPYENRPEEDTEIGVYNEQNAKMNAAMKEYPEVNDKGDLATKYGANESIFLKETEEITPKWVFEDKSLQQAIVYKDGNLVVTTYNKISQKYERFIYSKGDADEKKIPELEAMVDIKNLVGIKEIEKPEPAKTTKKDDNSSKADNDSSKTEPESSSQADSSQTDTSSQTDDNSKTEESSSAADNSKADETSKASSDSSKTE